LKKDEKEQRYFGARKSLIQEDILVQEICQYEKKKIFWLKKYEDKKDKFNMMHLISVTSDFKHKYILFNGQVLIFNNSHNKDNRGGIE